MSIKGGAYTIQVNGLRFDYQVSAVLGEYSKKEDADGPLNAEACCGNSLDHGLAPRTAVQVL